MSELHHEPSPWRLAHGRAAWSTTMALLTLLVVVGMAGPVAQPTAAPVLVACAEVGVRGHEVAICGARRAMERQQPLQLAPRAVLAVLRRVDCGQLPQPRAP